MENHGFPAQVRGDVWSGLKAPFDWLSSELSKTRVMDISRIHPANSKSDERLAEAESGYLSHSSAIPWNGACRPVYEGFQFNQLLRACAGLSVPDGIFLLYTSRMLATWERRRYHGRTFVAEFPWAVISTTGLVEAPAKPKRFYFAAMAAHRARSSGFSVDEHAEQAVAEDMKDEVLSFNDERLTSVACGVTLSAILFLLHLEPFCENPTCVHFNPHTQEELLKSHLSPRLCEKHERLPKKGQTG